MEKKQFLGFGFGPIQSGLMMYEAMKSGNFDRFTVAEVDASFVNLLRRNGNAISINIAYPDHIESARLDGFSILNPQDPADAPLLDKAIADADEMATAIPSIDFYGSGGAQSIAGLLARNINPEKPQLLYASENNNYAAEILLDEIKKHTPRERLKNFHCLNTVIGKMSGVKTSIDDIRELGLKPITPDASKAVLVEAFNRIYISKPGSRIVRGISVFEEKDDLLPFEEAKLFGHNAIHSMLGYCASVKKYRVMSDIRSDPELLAMGRSAFLNESGAALIKKYRKTGELLFTPAGFAAYANDLIDRMTNPFLHDEVGRICRDPRRKLSYSDRLVGSMREALRQGIEPQLLARGAAAAIAYLYLTNDIGGLPQMRPEGTDRKSIRDILDHIWSHDQVDEYRSRCIELIGNGWEKIRNGGAEN